jgi:tRNA threonylcarbamoyladenosine biosynthesis protein TsaE
VIALVGPLGAGKTLFAKAVAEGLGAPGDASSSPTFVIAHELPTPRGLRIVHADFYRVESVLELEGAGLLDWLEPGTLLLVEWGDRFSEALPKDRLEVSLAPGPEAESRRIGVRAGGPASAELLARWSDRWP